MPTLTEEIEEILELNQRLSGNSIDNLTLDQLIYVIARLSDFVMKDPPPEYDYRWSTLVQIVRRRLPKSLHIKAYHRPQDISVK